MVEKPTWKNTIHSTNTVFGLIEVTDYAFTLGYKYVLYQNKIYATSTKEIKGITTNDLKWESIKELLKED
mgnify:CR=1 FL=1